MEVIDFLFYGIVGDAGIVAQTCAISDFGVETLAGGQSFVFLDERENVERHLVVSAPRHIREAIINDSRHNVNVFFENRLRVDRKRCASRQAGQLLYGAEI